MSARRVPRPRLHARSHALARWAALTCAASLALADGTAWAQATDGGEADGGATDEVRAEALLDEGRALMMEGNLDAACAALEESHRLHDRGDTLLNLAECHRRQGKTATAWAEFDLAIAHADRVKFEDAMVVARVRRDELAAVLSTLTIVVPVEVASLAGLVVELDGAPLPADRWNTATVRDPGAFEVVARANGHRPFALRDTLGARKDQRTVVVALEVEPPPAAAPGPPPPPPPPVDAPPPLWPFVVGGAGIALLGASAGFGIASANAGSDLDDACGDGRARCPQSRRAELEGTRSTEVTTFGAFVGLGAGGILALGAAGLGLGLSWGDDADDGEAAARTTITAGPGSIGVRRSFH